MKKLTILIASLLLFNANFAVAGTQFISKELTITNKLVGYSINLDANCLPQNYSILNLISSLLTKNINKNQRAILTQEIKNLNLSNINTFSNNLNSVVQAYGLSAIVEDNKLYLYQSVYLLPELSVGKTIYNLQPNYIAKNIK